MSTNEELQRIRNELQLINEERQRIQEERQRLDQERQALIEERRQLAAEASRPRPPIFVQIAERSQLRHQQLRIEEREHQIHVTFCKLFIELTSYEEQLSFLKTTKLQLKWLPSPEMILDAFACYVSSVDDAIEIVQSLVANISSNVIICKEASKANGELMTIVDVIGSPSRSWKEHRSRPLFLEAFEKCGVLRAKDISQDVLREVFGPNYIYLKKPLVHFPDYPTPSEEEMNLYEALEDADTIHEFIDVLKTTTFDFNKMVDPEKLIQCETAKINDFESNTYHEWTIDDALQVAQIFKDRMGDVVIDRNGTYYNEKPSTLLDALDNNVSMFEYDTSSRLFLCAFEKLGFKRARNCSPYVLHYLHLNPGVTSDSVEWNHAKLKFEWCQPRFTILMRELIMEIFKPERIRVWLEAGNELEDYCN